MISIIIPAYNAEKYIRECIESVKAQTFTDWHGIVINDGSTDETQFILDEICDERFTVLTTLGPVGSGKARNYGIVHANGNDLVFLDADDWLEPDALEVMVEEARLNPDAGRIMTQPTIHWMHGEDTIWTIGSDKPLFSDTAHDAGHVTGCLYVMDNMPEEFGFPAILCYDDLLFNMGLEFAGVKTVIAQKSVYHYRRHSESLTYGPFTADDATRVRSAFSLIGKQYKAGKEPYARCSLFLENVLRRRLGL